jgi:trehalose 6-phosphate phosphatase
MTLESARLPAGKLALFLDIDGTLLEHQPRPDAVSVDAALRQLLDAIERRLDGALAFITGRSVATVDRLFAPLVLPIAGLYGLEHRLVKGGEVDPANEPEDVAAVAEALHSEFGDTKGLYFERKGPVLAIHTRGAPEALPAVRVAAERALEDLPAGYRIVCGTAGLEFMPAEALKGAAIRRFMALDAFRDRLPVFIGDDVSDENGFEYVNECGGISIRVRPAGPTSARHTLANVAAVRALLASMLPREEGAAQARTA